jgi:glutamate/tyrosine decarboxylase-like PLP-dependent enzyme
MPPSLTPAEGTRLRHLRQELATPLPHPDPATLQAHADQTARWLVEHFTTLPEQALGRRASRAEMEALLREPPPEPGTDFGQVLEQFRERVLPYFVRVSHPRFLAFIPGAPAFPAVLGEWLCAGLNCFAGVWAEAAGPTQVELVVLDWFKEWLGYPATAGGVLTGGGSEATLTALVVARDRLAAEERGRAVLYGSDQRHWSVDRAALVIGLRPEQVRTVPAAADGRLVPAALARAVGQDRRVGLLPWAVVASAGTTNTGAVDPLAAVADLCREEALWLHADAAYGWPAVLVPEGRTLLTGIERADSITLDPHKWFGQPFDVGCLLVRDGRLLGETFAQRPDYMEDVAAADDEVNFCDQGLALTRRFRALKLWLSIKVLGIGWFRALVRHGGRLAELADLLLRQAGTFEVLSPPRLGVVCFRYVPGMGRSDDELDRLNRAILEDVRAGGRAFLSSTRVGGRLALRFCFVNWRTTAADVEAVVRLLAESGTRLGGPPAGPSRARSGGE